MSPICVTTTHRPTMPSSSTAGTAVCRLLIAGSIYTGVGRGGGGGGGGREGEGREEERLGSQTNRMFR